MHARFCVLLLMPELYRYHRNIGQVCEEENWRIFNELYLTIFQFVSVVSPNKTKQVRNFESI